MLSALSCCIVDALRGPRAVMGGPGCLADQAEENTMRLAWLDAARANGLDKVAPKGGSAPDTYAREWMRSRGIAPGVSESLVIVTRGDA